MTLGCCCLECKCEPLAQYLQDDQISIPGYARLTAWESFSTGWQPPFQDPLPPPCCYRAYFSKTNCNKTTECRSCSYRSSQQSPSCTDKDTGQPLYNIYNGRNGSQREIALGCVIEIRVFRYQVGLNACTINNPLERCKTAIYAGWRDQIVIKSLLQLATDAATGLLATPCPMPPIPNSSIPNSCEETLVCNSRCTDFFNSTNYVVPCQSFGTDQVALRYWGAESFSYTWWRVKIFNQLPTGSVCFQTTDKDIPVCFRPNQQCLNTSFPISDAANTPDGIGYIFGGLQNQPAPCFIAGNSWENFADTPCSQRPFWWTPTVLSEPPAYCIDFGAA